MKINLLECISRIELFQSLSDHSKEQLADICLSREIRKKKLLFMQGDKGTAVYFCITGSVQLYKTTPDAQDVVIKIVKPGEMFAEVILFEQERYPVTAVALQEGLVLMLPKAQFDCLLMNMSFRNDFIGNLLGKLRYLANQVQYLTAHDVESRFFLFLKEQYGDKNEFKVNLSKKDISAAIGTTPETLSRLLVKLKEENKLVWKGKVVRLVR